MDFAVRLIEKPDCEECRLAKSVLGKEPNCSECLPVLYDENADAINVWLITKGQIISVGMGEVVDINHLAVWKVIEKLGIANEWDCFNKVVRVFHHTTQLMKDKSNDVITYDASAEVSDG